MNKGQLKAMLKRELRELESQKELFKQGLSSITRREMYLQSELERMGATSSAPRGYKHSLPVKDKNELLASLTTGSQLQA